MRPLPRAWRRCCTSTERLAPVLAGSGTGAQAAPRIVGAFCEALGLGVRHDLVARRRGGRPPGVPGAWGVDAPGIAEYLQHTQGRRPILNNAGIVGAAW